MMIDTTPHKILLEGDELSLGRDRWVLEWILVLIIACMAILLSRVPAARFAILNLFFLPVSMTGLYVGRHRSAAIALLCVVASTLALWHQATTTEWLGLASWGSVLAMQALVIGSLSDQRRREMSQLAEMHRTDTLSDALTKVANRRAFEYELARRMTEWNRQRTSLSLMLLDIDHFKRLNDTYGHQAGDVVLRQVAKRLSMHCRETDLVARYGGEEFAIIMPNTPGGEARKVAERTRESIDESEFDVGGLRLRATVSIGLAQIFRGEEQDDLVRRADVALYASKQTGRNCCHFHDGQNCEVFGAGTERAPTEGTIAPVSSSVADSYTDALTGLPSRKVYVEELRRRLSESRRYAADLSMMIVQVDDVGAKGFADKVFRRQINAMVADCIRQVLRDVDLVARFDEDQFAILMPRTRLADSLIPAERLRLRVAQSRSLSSGPGEVPVTISLGLASPNVNESAAQMVQRAQQSLWHAVRDGGNRVYIHQGDHIEALPMLPLDADESQPTPMTVEPSV